MAGGRCGRAGEGILVVSTTEVSLPRQAALKISQKDTHQRGAWQAWVLKDLQSLPPPTSLNLYFHSEFLSRCSLLHLEP